MNPLNQPQPVTEPAGRSDAMLLREFVEHGREDSFRALVARHVNLVFSAFLAHLIAPASARAGGSDRIHSAITGRMGDGSLWACSGGMRKKSVACKRR